jgi:hypothetical protein
MKIIDLVNDDPRKQLKPYEPMATAIVDTIREKGGCLPQDLNARGFTPREVADLWPVARALAALMMEP